MAGPTASLGNPRAIPYDAAKLPKSIQFTPIVDPREIPDNNFILIRDLGSP
jgi:hypothetical protein